MKERIAKKPRLFDAGGDLSKDWYVVYWYRNPYTLKLQRFREMKGLSKVKMDKLSQMSPIQIEEEKRRRYEIAPQIIAQLEKMLREGYNPYRNDQFIYSDEMSPLKMKPGTKSIESYLNEAHQICLHGRREGTVKNYRIYFNNFIEWIRLSKMEYYPITALEHGHAERFLSGLVTNSGNSNKYRNEHLSYLRRCFHELMKLYPKLLSRNPFELAAKIKHTRRKSPIYRSDLRAKIAKNLPEYDAQLWLFIQFIYYTGLRPGKELRLLQLNMLQMNDGVLVLPAELAKDNETRVVTIPQQLEVEIRKLKINKYPENYYLFSTQKKPGPVPTGKNYFIKAWKKFREKFNIPDDYKAYNWKHTGATSADDAGIDRRVIKEQLGHSSLQQTEEYLDSNKQRGSDVLREKFPSL